jgi:hypothetical protein
MEPSLICSGCSAVAAAFSDCHAGVDSTPWASAIVSASTSSTTSGSPTMAFVAGMGLMGMVNLRSSSPSCLVCWRFYGRTSGESHSAPEEFP